MFIDIDGPSAVGKTTLMSRLVDMGAGSGSPEVLENTRPPIKKPQNQDEFLLKQLWFFEQVISRYRHRSQSDITFIDIGYLDCLLHTRYYSSFRKNDWNIMKPFSDIVLEKYADARISDGIIFLETHEHTLRMRKQGDPGTSRTNHDENMELYVKKKKFYHELARKYPEYVYIIDAEQSIDDVYEHALERIQHVRSLITTHYTNDSTATRPTLEEILQSLLQFED